MISLVTINKIATIRRDIHHIRSADRPDIEAGTLNLTQELFEVIGFRNVDMAELRIHTPAERVAIAEGHLFRVAFAIFFQLSQAAEFQDVPLFPGVFFFPATRSVYDAVLTWIFRVLILLSPPVFSPHHLLSFGSRGFDVSGPAFCSLRYSPSPF